MTIAPPVIAPSRLRKRQPADYIKSASEKALQAVVSTYTVARHGRPDLLLYYDGGIGDELLCTVVLRELHLRGRKNVWMRTRYPDLFRYNEDAESIAAAGEAIHGSLQQGGKLLLFGNGGSAADAQHVAAEFVGRFIKDRDPLPAIALTTDTSALTAIGNDYGYERVFSRQVEALGRPRDVVLAISTSGRSPSVLAGVDAARNGGMVTIGLTGGSGGELAQCVDIAIVVPAKNMARMQECHLTIEHILCEVVEQLLATA